MAVTIPGTLIIIPLQTWDKHMGDKYGALVLQWEYFQKKHPDEHEDTKWNLI